MQNEILIRYKHIRNIFLLVFGGFLTSDNSGIDFQNV